MPSRLAPLALLLVLLAAPAAARFPSGYTFRSEADCVLRVDANRDAYADYKLVDRCSIRQTVTDDREAIQVNVSGRGRYLFIYRNGEWRYRDAARRDHPAAAQRYGDVIGFQWAERGNYYRLRIAID